MLKLKTCAAHLLQLKTLQMMMIIMMMTYTFVSDVRRPVSRLIARWLKPSHMSREDGLSANLFAPQSINCKIYVADFFHVGFVFSLFLENRWRRC